MITNLPNDIIKTIFSFLDPVSLSRIRFCCCKCLKIASEDLFWKAHCTALGVTKHIGKYGNTYFEVWKHFFYLPRIISSKIMATSNPTDVSITDLEVMFIVLRSRELIVKQPTFLELEGPLKIAGCTYSSLKVLKDLFKKYHPSETAWLFLGNYVDRGKYGVLSTLLLLSYKIQYPYRFFLLRGDHETAPMNRIYGFRDECKRTYNVKVWRYFTDVWNALPIAALVDDKIFCVHGGFSPELKNFDQIRNITRPTEIPVYGLLCDLICTRPNNAYADWNQDPVGDQFQYGINIINKFHKILDIDHTIVSNYNKMVFGEGYEWVGKLLSIFSCPNFQDLDNKGGIANVDEDSKLTVEIIEY